MKLSAQIQTSLCQRFPHAARALYSTQGVQTSKQQFERRHMLLHQIFQKLIMYMPGMYAMEHYSPFGHQHHKQQSTQSQTHIGVKNPTFPVIMIVTLTSMIMKMT